ncbi:MAG: Na+/H+ antiporter NhaA [Pirellulales bacterium]
MKVPEWLPEPNRPHRAGGGHGKTPVERLTRPVARFMEIEAAGGIVLLVCTLAAIAIAQTAARTEFEAIWQMRVGLAFGPLELFKPLRLWINDGLMTIFFFVVGLEIKAEFVRGELRDPRKAAAPVAAALGGMLAPAAIYLALQWNQPGERGWAIPMATDIAFVVGFMALLGRRVPFNLKILLLTLAIVDDLGAVLVIAAAYTDQIALGMLGLSVAGFAVVFLLNKIGVRAIGVYVVIGAGIWLAFLKSGIHPTVAGVLLGVMTPASAWFERRSLMRVTAGVARQLQIDEEQDEPEHLDDAVSVLATTARETVAPLDRLQTALHSWTAFIIMPLFALANAGVAFQPSQLQEPITWSVAAGLVIGKPLGIMLLTWLAVAVGLARLPEGVSWKALFGGAALAGIGFTMSLFIAGLALSGDALSAGKLGTMIGSGASAVLGCAWLLYAGRRGAA